MRNDTGRRSPSHLSIVAGPGGGAGPMEFPAAELPGGKIKGVLLEKLAEAPERALAFVVPMVVPAEAMRGPLGGA